jgi:hypothetical protein
MIVPALARDPGVAGQAADHHKRRRRLREIVPAGPERARLEAEAPGREQDAADPDRAVGHRRRRPDLGQVERPVQHVAQLGKRADQVIRSRRRWSTAGLAPAYPLRQRSGAGAEPSGKPPHGGGN